MSETEKTAPERLLEVIEYSKMSKNAFAKHIGHSNGTMIYHVLNGRNGISEKLTNEICKKFPEVNFLWLLKGIGKMLFIEKKETPKDDLLERIEFLEEHIKGINARLKLLEQQQDAKLTTPNKELA